MQSRFDRCIHNTTKVCVYTPSCSCYIHDMQQASKSFLEAFQKFKQNDTTKKEKMTLLRFSWLFLYTYKNTMIVGLGLYHKFSLRPDFPRVIMHKGKLESHSLLNVSF